MNIRPKIIKLVTKFADDQFNRAVFTFIHQRWKLQTLLYGRPGDLQFLLQHR